MVWKLLPSPPDLSGLSDIKGIDWEKQKSRTKNFSLPRPSISGEPYNLKSMANYDTTFFYFYAMEIIPGNSGGSKNSLGGYM